MPRNLMNLRITTAQAKLVLWGLNELTEMVGDEQQIPKYLTPEESDAVQGDIVHVQVRLRNYLRKREEATPDD